VQQLGGIALELLEAFDELDDGLAQGWSRGNPASSR
jgi:hypothetical protein